MYQAIHTSDSRHFKRLWHDHGGVIFPIDGTGEVRYEHAAFNRSVRTNNRRKDVSAKLLSRLNALIRQEAANDAQINP